MTTTFFNADYNNNPLPTAQAFAATQPAGTTSISQDSNGAYVETGLTPPNPVPQHVLGTQLRMAVLDSPQFATIAAFLAAQNEGVQMAYNTTAIFARDDMLLAGIVTAGKLTSAEVDAIFITAAGIIV